MLDEVQAGIGRTGDFLAYGQSGISPDAVAMAKGLGGFPIGAFWISEQYSEVFKPGSAAPLLVVPLWPVRPLTECRRHREEGLVKKAREKDWPCERIKPIGRAFPRNS